MKKDNRPVTRRRFLTWLSGAAAGLLGITLGRPGGKAAQDRDLREADYYAPHDDAG